MSDPTLPRSTLPLFSDYPLPTSSGISTMPFLSFNGIPNMTTCSSGVIGWSTSDDLHNLTLLVTNYFFHPPTTLIDKARLEQRPTFRFYWRRFGPFPDPGLMNSYTWSPVDLPGGTYIVRAITSERSFPTTSSPFTITNGTDISCLNAVIATSSSSSLPTATSSRSSSPIATSSSTPGPAPSSTSTDTNFDSFRRVAGVIAGTVVGVAVLVALIVGLKYCRVRQQRRTNGMPILKR
ncbi:hypothetical protein QCA50_011737 [Cerrena zonata]|uniref:Uncharacterized protein n=1 Tax=Cerrena zonata TaxID=2478898 RepID=A0AAW0G0L7_9APHY